MPICCYFVEAMLRKEGKTKKDNEMLLCVW